jgi:hypothetical protein
MKDSNKDSCIDLKNAAQHHIDNQKILLLLPIFFIFKFITLNIQNPLEFYALLIINLPLTLFAYEESSISTAIYEEYKKCKLEEAENTHVIIGSVQNLEE